MNWNFPAGDFTLRLPVTDQDASALYALMSRQEAVDHIPRQAMSVGAQAMDELRRVAMRFETREAAFWLVENGNGELRARIGIQRINWMLLAAQLQWELADNNDLAMLQQVMPAVEHFVFSELGLHRLEMRVCEGAAAHEDLLAALGFTREGVLPAQQEYEGNMISYSLWSRLATD